MATFTLIPFETTKYNLHFTADINKLSQELFVSFTVTGENFSQIDLGEYRPNYARLKNLWEKTCFEFFIKNKKGEYLEFNFSPNFSWNTYEFKEIRGPLKEYGELKNIEIDILNSSNKFFLAARIPIQSISHILDEETQFSFNGVFKYKNGETEYWALKHSDSKPNFHQFESFIGKF